MKSPNYIAKELEELRSKLPKNAPVSGFVVEEDYFLNFPLQMLEKVKAVSGSGNFSVPPGYFDQFPSKILSAVKTEGLFDSEVKKELYEISPLLAGMVKKMPFSVPEGYFNSFSELGLFKKETVEEETALLPQNLKNSTSYTLPQDYFENFPGKVLEKLKNREEGKLVKMRPFYLRWKNLAAAAVIIGLLITGAWFMNQPQAVNSSDIGQAATTTLDEISIDELHAYLETQSPAIMNQVEEAERFILEEEDFEIMFTNLTDQDLQGYLVEYVGMVN